VEFINHTPFGAAAYRALDTNALEHDVVVLRTVYRLAPVHDGDLSWLVPSVIDEEAPGLITEDQHAGATGASSVIAESDLAPYKPRCDVLLAGAAHAPWGKPATSWLTRLRVSHEVDGEHLPLLDKTLRVHGPRRFVHAGGAWAVETAAPATRVPIAAELAYGGACWLGHEQQEVNYTNPLGCGWWHAGWLDALRAAGAPAPEALPAPQWEHPEDPITQPDFTRQPAGLTVPQMAELRYAHRPAGFGAVGRAWTPRIQQAGRYDDTWLKWSWPQLPRDFNMGYWCAAPADQQVEDFLPAGATIELAHLVPPEHCPTGHAVIRLPGHRAGVLWRTASGLVLTGEMVIDTVLIDTTAMTLALTWRTHLAGQMQATRAELVYQTRPDKPLFNLKVVAEPSHG
jgi:hypothetical protein